MTLEQQLIERLNTLQPTHLEVINESAGHGGYFPGKESHFKVAIVSPIFQGTSTGATSPKSLCSRNRFNESW